MGRGCGGVNFPYTADEDTYQIYLAFEAIQIDIKDNPYLENTKVQVRDSCSWPRGYYPNKYKFPLGMALSYPYYDIYKLPCKEDGTINPNTGAYYTSDELFQLYPWACGSKVDYTSYFALTTSKLYSWGKRIYSTGGDLQFEESTNTVECDILYYLDHSFDTTIVKALVNRNYKNCQNGMFWRMQKRGSNPTYTDSNTLPPAFFLPNKSQLSIYHQATYSRIYPFFKWFDYYENFNPRKKGYTTSSLQFYHPTSPYSKNITEVVFNFFGISLTDYEESGMAYDYYYSNYPYTYIDTNILPPYLVYESLSDALYTMSETDNYIYIRRKFIPNYIDNIDYQSDMTWPKSITLKINAKVSDIIDTNYQGFGPPPMVPQDVSQRANDIANILKNGITLRTNESYFNANYYASESKNYKYYKQYTSPDGTNKIIDDNYDFYIIKENDRSVLAYESNIPYRIKDRGGFIVAHFSNDTNQWKYKNGYWKLQSGSDAITNLKNHKYIQPVLGFDGTALSGYYLVIYNNKTGQYYDIIDLYNSTINFSDGITPSAEDGEFNPSNFRKKLPSIVSYSKKSTGNTTSSSNYDMFIDLQSPTTDKSYRARFALPNVTLEIT